jgi:hypothetical protein
LRFSAKLPFTIGAGVALRYSITSSASASSVSGTTSIGEIALAAASVERALIASIHSGGKVGGGQLLEIAFVNVSPVHGVESDLTLVSKVRSVFVVTIQYAFVTAVRCSCARTYERPACRP